MASSTEVKFILLASEWESKRGGLSNFNRVLAIELAKHSKVHVSVFVPRCDQDEIDDAKNKGVALIRAKSRPGLDENDWLCFLPDDLQVDVVIGHGVVLGHQAQIISRELRRCKYWIQFVHTDPEELGMFKDYPDPIEKGEKKHQTEVELCAMADFVVAVGPKLADAYRQYLRSHDKDQHVFDLTPGICNEFSGVKQATQDGNNCRVLALGDAEDFKLKGFDIAANAVGQLQDAILIFVGADNKQQDGVAIYLKQCDIPSERLRVRKFVERREELRKLFREVDVAIMPSRTEGFGLTALEALSAGLPVLVGGNSGFGKALSKVPFGSGYVIQSEDPMVWAEEIKKVWAKDRKTRLEESDKLRKSYAKKHSWAKQCNDLVEHALNIVTDEAAPSLKRKASSTNSPESGTGASPSRSRRVSDESITLKLEQTRLEVDGSEGEPAREQQSITGRVQSSEALKTRRARQEASKGQGAILSQYAVGKTKAPVPLTDYPEPKRTKRFYFKGVGSPEAESEGDTETETGSREHMECAQTKSDDEMNVEVSGDSLETDSEALSEDWIKSMLSTGTEKCEVDESGAVWKLQSTMAACLTFPQNAVKTTVVFQCIPWQSTTDFPPLKKNEALVSNVIVLACDDLLGSDFTGHFDEKVSVALSHSAANLQGYEVVIKELVDPDNNVWKDLKTTNIWKTSDTQCDPSSTPRIPFSEAKVTRCSVFAVICRLKTYTFSTQGHGKQDFSCTVPEYPDVTVTIPASVVHKNGDFQLTLKVQEIPQQWFDDHEIIGPVLHIGCSPAIELVEPAIITIPTSLQADKNVCAESSFQNAHVRLLMKSDEESSQWTEITDQLPRPADLKNGLITFQATHFTWFSPWITMLFSPNPNENVPLENRALRLTEHVPLEAGFSACLCRSGESTGESLLRYICYPIAQEVPVRNKICDVFDVFRYGYGNSLEPLCPGEKIYLELKKGLEPIDDEDALVELRFPRDRHGKFENGIDVRISSEVGPVVEFFRYLDVIPPRKQSLCKLSIIPYLTTRTKNSRPVKAGKPSDDELEKLSRKLGHRWKSLGRRLRYSDAALNAFRKDTDGIFDATRCMLVDWTQRMGSEATYQILYDALTDELVGCKLLAEEFCCN